MTLEEAREQFFAGIRQQQTKCPCCDKVGMMYSRPLNLSMAKALIWAYKAKYHAQFHDLGGWVDFPRHAPRTILATNQHSTLVWYGLMRRMSDQSGVYSGVYRITEKGEQFARDLLPLQANVLHYNDTVYGFEGMEVYCSDLFVKASDYLSEMDEPITVRGVAA